MPKDIIAVAVDILNSSNTLGEKRELLRAARKRRRTSSKQLLDVIERLLSESVLPVRAGNELQLYGFSNISEDLYSKLGAVLNKSHCIPFNALCGEILWLHYHDVHYANISIYAYYHELEASDSNRRFEYTRAALGICRIYAKYQDPAFPYDSFFDNCTEYLCTHLDDDNFCALFILEGLTTCNLYLERIEQITLESIEHYEFIRNYRKAIAFGEFLEKIYSSQKQKEDVAKIIRRMAIDYEKDTEQYDWSDSRSAFKIIDKIQAAMKLWSRLHSEDALQERRRLAKKINPIKQKAIENMQRVQSKPIDLTDPMRHMQDVIDSSTFEKAILCLANLTSLQNQHELSRQQEQSGSLSNIFASAFLDRNGRKRCVIPSIIGAGPEEKLAFLEQKAAQWYTIFADAILSRYLHLMRTKFNFSEENLQFLVDNSAFVPTDRKKSFLKGLVAGFNCDYITAMSLLMPQVENALRVIAELSGAVVYKTNSDGTEDCLSLESVLKQPEVVDCLDDTLLFNLRLFYTSKYGFGMRNIISHGLDSDNELQSAQCLAVWWFTLHLCCMFNYKLLEIVSGQEAAPEHTLPIK